MTFEDDGGVAHAPTEDNKEKPFHIVESHNIKDIEEYLNNMIRERKTIQVFSLEHYINSDGDIVHCLLVEVWG